MEEKKKAAAPMEDKPKEEMPKKEDVVSSFLQESQATEEGAPGNPPSWVADEALWEKAKRASEAALERVDYAFVVWWYLNNGGEKKGAEAASAEKQAEQVEGQLPSAVAIDTAAPQVDENPHLAQARQTNVLLGTLIALTQEMSKKLDGLVAMPAPMAESQAAEQPEAKQSEEVDTELAKMLECVASNLKSVNNSLGAFRA